MGKIKYKKCPECLYPIPVHETKCPSCNISVGKLNKYGFADKKGTWVSYVICILSWLFLAGYIWWAFLKDKNPG